MISDARHRRFFAERPFVAALAIALLTLAAYANSLRGGFVFDDEPNIVMNPRIRQLWPLRYTVFHSSRPILQFSFAVNYAISGLRVTGYHVGNLIIHVLAALALFGVARRTYALVTQRGLKEPPVIWVPAAIAALWAVHPLQTQAVTYVIQRSESLMGLFFLLTLYCVIRAAHTPQERTWLLRAIGCCALGMATKPVMVAAPLVVLLYDRVFLSKSFAELWRRRWDLYVGFAATWGLLAAILWSGSFDWIETAGNSAAASAGEYLRTQLGVIQRYLFLALWPGPLTFDYHWPVANTAAAIVPGALLLGALIAGIVWVWRSRPWLGFLGAWFLLTLAPSSSAVPIVDMAFEPRMYLPLAGVIAAGVVGLLQLWKLTGIGKIRWLLPEWVLLAIALTLVCRTAFRNHDYRTPVALWTDTIAKRPHNAQAHHGLAKAFADAGRFAEAIPHCQEALRLDPTNALITLNLGRLSAMRGDLDEAARCYRRAVELAPGSAEAHYYLGTVLLPAGQLEEAIQQFKRALQISPAFSGARTELNKALALQALAQQK